MKILNLSESKRFFAVGVSLATAIFLFFEPIAACSWDYLIWQNRAENSDPYYRFIKNNKAGFIDRAGKIVIKPTLRVYGNYQDGVINGLLETNYDEYIDIRTGREVSREFYNQHTAPVKDWTAERNNTVLYGFADREGRTVIEPKYVYAKDFSEDLAPVVLKGPCSYYNSEAVCPGASIFPVGYTIQPDSACEFSFIDKSGKQISKQTFLDVKDFSEGLAAVKTENGWGYLGKNGKLVIKPQFQSAQSFSQGLALVKLNGLFGYVNPKGEFVIKPQFETAESFADGFASVGTYADKTVDNEFFYIDRNGNRLANKTYFLASSFFKGIAHVLISETRGNETKDDGTADIRTRKFAYINLKGEEIFNYSVEDEM